MPLTPLITNSGPSASLYAPAAGGGGGGGGGPNLVVSTMSVNDSGNVLMTWNNGGATLNFGFEATNTSSFILQQGVGVAGTKVAGPEGCLQALEKDGGANQVFAPLQAAGFEVCATAYPGGAFAGLYFSSIGSVLYSAVGQPLTIDAPAGVSLSSLSVSSINGAAPGGGVGPSLSVSTLLANDRIEMVGSDKSSAALSFYKDATQTTYANMKYDATPGISSLAIYDAPGGNPGNLYVSGDLRVSSINGAAPAGGSVYPLNSTLKTGEGVGLSINASSLTTLAAYSTISSHFYTVSVDLLPKDLTQAFGPNDGYQTQLTTEDGLVNILNDGLWSQISTLNNLSITPGLGGSATFKAGGSYFTIDIYNNYANTLSTNLNAIFAVDHGPGN